MSTDLSLSVLRILKPNGTTAGTGFIVDERLAVTCAHVIRAASAQVGHMVPVVFQRAIQPQTALVTECFDADDVAFLELDTGDRITLQLGPAAESGSQSFRAFGYPEGGHLEARWADGKIGGMVQLAGCDLLQLDGEKIDRGLSGGPVWSNTTECVVGMVTAIEDLRRSGVAPAVRLGYATPTEILWRLRHTLQPRLTTMINPFFTSGLIRDPNQFFGRTALVREIRAELTKRASVSIVGESQMGKSSLLYHIAQTLAIEETRVIYLDLQSVFDEADFCETLLRKLGAEGDTPRHLKRALEGRATILLLDELERLGESDFSPRLHDLLRSLAQDPYTALSLCVATQRPLVEVIPQRNPTSPFHNIFTTKLIGPFTEAEAHAFLQTRLSLTSVVFTRREIARLVTESYCHPAELQRRAKALFYDKVSL